MPAHNLTQQQIQQAVEALAAHGGNQSRAAESLGLHRATFLNRIKAAELAEAAQQQADEQEGAPTTQPVSHDALRRMLRNGRHSLEDLALGMKTTRGAVLDALDSMRQTYAVQQADGKYFLDTTPQSGTDKGDATHVYTSRADGSYVFGFTSDNHIGSKYARDDVLAALFRRFADVGVDRVLNAGNWIDGEASFNKHDLVVHGMHQQCVHLAQTWPRADFKTYAVTGDDHEGWYAQREGVDIGRYAEQCFRDQGRTDWVDLGYMEADISLVHADSGVKTRLRVAHPGGGSSYATSYAPQKYIESLDGGEKPAVVLLGHWHKMEVLNIRNVWVIQTGCTQDQTPFGRKKRLDFHVGGGLCRLVQDPKSGAIVSCTVEMLRFFNRAHYGTGRWSHHGPVTMADRNA